MKYNHLSTAQGKRIEPQAGEQNQDQLQRERLPYTNIENAILEDFRVLKKTVMRKGKPVEVDVRITAYEIAVYTVLCKHATGDGSAWPSYVTIAAEARCSERQAEKSVGTLVLFGYLKKIMRRKAGKKECESNLYIILSQYYVKKRSRGSVHSTPRGVHSTKELYPKNIKYKSSSSGTSTPGETLGKQAFLLKEPYGLTCQQIEVLNKAQDRSENSISAVAEWWKTMYHEKQKPGNAFALMLSALKGGYALYRYAEWGKQKAFG